MLDSKNLMNQKIKRWLKIIVLFAVVLFFVSLVFNKYFWNSFITGVQMKITQKRIQQQEQKYINDTYGGKTPEETYSMFLEALKRKDIELASKYFVLEKQKEYAKALKEIDGSGKWDLMMEDLLQKNLKWRITGKTIVALEIFNDKNEFLTQIDFLLPVKTFSNNETLSDIWKISSF